MKILHLIQKKQLRGAEVFTSQLSNHIKNMGNEALVVPVFKGDATLPFSGKIIELEATASKKYWDIKGWKNLARIIKNEQPDIIQANAGDTLKYAIFSKLLFGWKQPVVFRNASTISLYIKSNFVKKLYGFLFSKTEKIISVSQASALDFAKLFPHCKNKITVIPIGIEEETAETKTSLNPFKSLTSSGPVLVHVGGFSFEKNHKGLIEIFKRVSKCFPGATLHLVGDGPLRNEIENIVQQQNLSSNILFHGFQKDPLRFISHADVLMLPSIIEGLPGVILEAFYCKTAVVAYNTGGIKEIVIPGQTGHLIELNNDEAFASAVINVLENKEQTEKLVSNAFQLVTTEYLNTQVAKRFLDVYKKLSLRKNTSLIKTPVPEL